MFEELAREVAQRMAAALPPGNRVPGRVSVWLRFVQMRPMDGSLVEQTVGATSRTYMTALDAADLYDQLAAQVLLKVFGQEEQVVADLPNLIVKVLDQKGRVPMPGAAPLENPDQIWLKVTVYEFQPNLWERLFGRPEQAG